MKELQATAWVAYGPKTRRIVVTLPCAEDHPYGGWDELKIALVAAQERQRGDKGEEGVVREVLITLKENKL